MLYPNQRLQRWCFDVELLFLAGRLGIPVAEVSVNWTEIPGLALALVDLPSFNRRRAVSRKTEEKEEEKAGLHWALNVVRRHHFL